MRTPPELSEALRVGEGLGGDCGRAIAMFREMKKHEAMAEYCRIRLGELLANLDAKWIDEYVKRTTAIDQAVDLL